MPGRSPTPASSTATRRSNNLAATTTGLIAARGGIAHCHAALVETRKTIPGLRTVGFGDEECPPPKGQVMADLRVVA